MVRLSAVWCPLLGYKLLFLQNADQPLDPRLVDVNEIFCGEQVSDFGRAAMAVHKVDGFKADQSEVGSSGEAFRVAGEASFLFGEPFGVFRAGVGKGGGVQGQESEAVGAG